MPVLPDFTTHTPFRIAEKHFKNRSVPNVYPSLRKTPVLDLSRPAEETDDEVWQAGWWGPDTETGRRLKKGKARARGERPEQDLAGLKRVELADGKVGWLVKEGCILIPGYLSAEQQLHIAEAALSRYTLPPNPLSLSPHWDLPTDLFSTYSTAPETLIHPLHQSRAKSDDHASQGSSTAPGDTIRQIIDTDPAAVVDYAEILAKNKTSVDIAPSDKLKPKTANDLIKELRWANLGWVYQWTTKAYDFSPPEPIEFPTEMASLCTDVVRSIPWPEVFADVSHADKSKRPEWSTWGDDYRPDTGIVNFYQMSDTLMGHVDRAELDPSRPLVSVSLGHACIFLLGSSSRQDSPQPVILRSGDVLVMSGKGRQSYHGVPRIMEGTLPAHFLPQSTDTETTSAVKRFISTARINMNARQVFPPGFERPP